MNVVGVLVLETEWRFKWPVTVDVATWVLSNSPQAERSASKNEGKDEGQCRTRYAHGDAFYIDNFEYRWVKILTAWASDADFTEVILVPALDVLLDYRAMCSGNTAGLTVIRTRTRRGG